jgi:4-hydroxythreonine-4-phosphate dehydrogenase
LCAKYRILPKSRATESGIRLQTAENDRLFLHAWLNRRQKTNAGFRKVRKIKMPKSRIGITMGDAAGIGPEVSLKALAQFEPPIQFDCVLIGSAAVWQAAAAQVGFPHKLEVVTESTRLGNSSEAIGVLDCAPLTGADFSIGQPNAATGRAAGISIREATRLALARQIDAVVTAPIQKTALHAGGFHFPGHTEMLQSLSGVGEVVMLMYSQKLATALVSTHLPLSQSARMIRPEKIRRVIELSTQFLNKLQIPDFQIAVAAYNPHAGEGGLFGLEEIEIIGPAVDRARAEGYPVAGPFPPDTVFAQAFHGRYQLVVAMYHDQGLIPFKLVAFDEGVNVTLGLPFWRTSPDHGTALDIAGKNLANATSMIAAIRLAIRLSAQPAGRETK